MTEFIERSVPLYDIEIDRSEGDGRVVTAYAATFDTLYPVQDWDGDYDEQIDRAAFNDAIGRGIDSVQVLFNHGMTIHGTASDRYSMPLGTPLEIRPDGRGLLTRTRYAKTELADEILELIRSGAIRAQSFHGAVYKSAPRTTGANGRTIVTRLKLGLKEYGPATFAANTGAGILAVRSAAPPTAPALVTAAVVPSAPAAGPSLATLAARVDRHRTAARAVTAAEHRLAEIRRAIRAPNERS